MFLISILFTVRESLLVNVQNYKMPIFVLYCILKSVENNNGNAVKYPVVVVDNHNVSQSLLKLLKKIAYVNYSHKPLEIQLITA